MLRNTGKHLGFARYELTKDHAGRNLLAKINYLVSSVDPEQAAHEGLEKIRAELTYLRLRHYVRTSICGEVSVTLINGGESTNIPLPQPFWAQERARRPVPHIPPHFREFLDALPSPYAMKWRAAMNHLSAAIYTWIDDPHSAASFVWQALEAVASTQLKSNPLTDQLIQNYLASLWRELGYVVAIDIAGQAKWLKFVEPKGDWHYYSASEGGKDQWLTNLEQWIETVCRPGSPRGSVAWHRPKAWAILADDSVGLLPLVWDLRQGPISNGPGSRLMERLQGDLKLLYGLRNSLVHEGVREGNGALATYLARVGLEILFWGMRELKPPPRYRRRPGSGAKRRWQSRWR